MGRQVTTHDLWVDGKSITITTGPISPTGEMTLTWNTPVNPKAFNGAVVLLSNKPFTAESFPVDGTRYSGSTAWTVPATSNGVVGDAQVVAAFYGFFGDVTTQTSVTVTGLDPNSVYYASIHAASNVLQYYTQGQQSYPLEANNPTKQNSAFAGSIPQASQPPANPSNGQVYFDVSTSTVYMWNIAQGAWIRANDKAVRTSPTAIVERGVLFFDQGGNDLKFFDGSQWVLADTTNLRVKMGPVWALFTGSAEQTGALPQTATVGDFILFVERQAISAPRVLEVMFYSMGQWLKPTPDQVQVNIGGTWEPISTPSYWTAFGPSEPLPPSLGDFYYNLSTQDLMIWDGATWVKADSAEEGVPSYSKVNVGTDGTSAAREMVINDVKTRLGYPVVCVELKEENFNRAVNSALSQIRQRADNAYEHRHISFTILGGPTGGQNVYYLNDPRDGTNRIVNVLKIHRINQLGISSLSAETGLYAQSFFNQLYQGSNVDILSIHLMAQLSESYQRIFAGDIMFTWNEARRELTILRRIIQAQERVVLEVMMEREEQDLISDRYLRSWIQDWAYADSMEQLGLIRTKYPTGLPSATGGLSLNGDTLLQKASDLKTELLRQISDFEIGNGTSAGNAAFLIG